MSEAVVAQKSPYSVEVTEGETYAWCGCGRSAKQPYCDGTHKDFDMTPTRFTAEKTDTVFLCGCKASANPPFCDGSHKNL